ncbi:unnamed protein product [Rotaria sp. Silwood2]|nr:unnamed protein product [Rotaria sp. Silwood2]
MNLDPEDIAPLGIHDLEGALVLDPRDICERLLRNVDMNSDRFDIMVNELINSVEHQDWLFQHLPALPNLRSAFIEWEQYAQLAFASFLPPMLEHGLGFEAHGQNTLVRFHPDTGELLGFAIRDLNGIKVHVTTFQDSTKLKLDIAVGSYIIAEDLKAVYDHVFHCLIQSQLQRLVRALDLHYCGTGWAIVREEARHWIMEGSPADRIWFGSTVRFTSFVRTKMCADRCDADTTTIQQAFRRLTLLYHPDKHRDARNEQLAMHLFIQVKSAYDILNDPQKRAIYDVIGMKGLKIEGWEASVHATINLADVFISDVLPKIETTDFSVEQGIDIPLTSQDNTATINASVTTRNGRGIGTLTTSFRRISSDLSWFRLRKFY